VVAVALCISARGESQEDAAALSERYYQQAVQLLNGGRYQEALESLDKAIELNPEPVFFCNRGAVLLRLGQGREALTSMERCLETIEVSDSGELAHLEAEVNALRVAVRGVSPRSREVALGIATRPAPSSGPGEAAPVVVVTPAPAGPDWLAWGSGALGGAALLGALTLVTQPLLEEYQEVGRQGEDRGRYDALRDQIEGRKLGIGALLVSGVALTALSGALFWWGGGEPEEPVGLRLEWGQGGPQVGLKVVFE
jgi:tetratricopeptide (TPR) repeat protein